MPSPIPKTPRPRDVVDRHRSDAAIYVAAERTRSRETLVASTPRGGMSSQADVRLRYYSEVRGGAVRPDAPDASQTSQPKSRTPASRPAP